MTPEQIIQAAFVERSNRDRDARKVEGFFGPQATWPAWAPEVAAAALREAGLINVGGSPASMDSTVEGAERARHMEGDYLSFGPETHPSSSDPISSFIALPHEGRALLGAPKPLSPEEWAVVDELEKAFTPLEQAMRDLADEGEWPEVGC